MYSAELAIKNFRRLSDVTLRFVPGLNVLVGPNNVGKPLLDDAGAETVRPETIARKSTLVCTDFVQPALGKQKRPWRISHKSLIYCQKRW
jgi:predicted ATP-dependent endonuclease of OLD family